MATDGASCESDFIRAPEDAAGDTAEATVTKVPDWARGECRRGLGSLLEPACDPELCLSLGSPECPFPRGAPTLGCPLGQWPGPVGLDGCLRWGSFQCFPSPARSSPVRPVLGASYVRPLRPLSPLRSGLAREEGWRVFPGKFDPPPHTHTLFSSLLSRGCGCVSPGCLAPLSGPRKAAKGGGSSLSRCGDVHCVCSCAEAPW